MSNQDYQCLGYQKYYKVAAQTSKVGACNHTVYVRAHNDRSLIFWNQTALKGYPHKSKILEDFTNLYEVMTSFNGDTEWADSVIL